MAMFSPFLGLIALAGTRLVSLAVGVGLWLLTRPGGWAVLVAAVLVGSRLLPRP